jgi:phosphate transport system substrate-binding protein
MKSSSRVKENMNPMKILNYAMGAVFLALGVAITAGWLTLRSPDPKLKIMFGVVLILFGLYKIFMASMKRNKPSGRNLMAVLGVLCLAGMMGLGACGKAKKPPRQTITSGDLTVIVPESHKHLFDLEASEFMRYYRTARVRILPASTREAIVHLLNDSVKVVAADRPLNGEEREVARKAAMRLEEFPVAEDAMAVLVNSVNSVESISLETLGRIASGRIRRWEQLPASRLTGPIALVMTGRNSGAYELIQKSFFPTEEDLALAALADSQTQVLEKTASLANGIGLASLACFKDTANARWAEKLKPLAFAVTDTATGRKAVYGPRQDYVYHGRYPLHYTVTLIQNLEGSPLATGFISFISSTPGQKIFANWGLVPKKIPIRFVQLTQDDITP